MRCFPFLSLHFTHTHPTYNTQHKYTSTGASTGPSCPAGSSLKRFCGESATARRAAHLLPSTQGSSTTTTTTMDDGPPRDLERIFAELGLRKYGLGEEEDEAVADGTCCSGGEGAGVVYGRRVCREEGLCLTLLCTLSTSQSTRQLACHISLSHTPTCRVSLPFPPSPPCPPSLPPQIQPVASARGSVGGSWCSAPSYVSPSSFTASCWRNSCHCPHLPPSSRQRGEGGGWTWCGMTSTFACCCP